MQNSPMDFLPDNANEDEVVFEVLTPEEERLLSPEEKDVFSQVVHAKFPHIKRVVGVSSSLDEEFVMTRLTELAEEGLKKQEDEFEKTEKEIELINFATTAADEILSQFGGNDLYDISLERIHVIGDRKEVRGHWSCNENCINLSRQKSSVNFTIASFHELIHSKIYNALQIPITRDKKDLVSYRDGLDVFSRDGKEEYMELVNEMTVYELEKTFFNKYIRENTSFSEEEKVAELASVKRGPNRRYIRSGASGDLSEVFESFSRSLLKEIGGLPEFSEYKNHEDVKNLLIKSAISGDVLKLGRMIKKAFGSIKG